MNTATQQPCTTDAEVLQFWCRQAQLQRTAFDAVADYLTNHVGNARMAPAQDAFDRPSH